MEFLFSKQLVTCNLQRRNPGRESNPTSAMRLIRNILQLQLDALLFKPLLTCLFTPRVIAEGFISIRAEMNPGSASRMNQQTQDK
jgi:hypothetical protein